MQEEIVLSIDISSLPKLLFMKKSVVFILALSLSAQVFSQQNDPVRLSPKESLLVKSKHQKTGAFVLLAGGAALVGGGYLIGNSKEATFDDAGTGVVMAGAGILSMLGSIPLFIASKRNMNRAMKASAWLNIEHSFYAEGLGLAGQYYPAVKIRIAL